SLAKPIAPVALAWESQSTSSVRWSAAARQEARFTAVVVFPTPPFWFATAMMRAKNPPGPECWRKSSKVPQRCARSFPEMLLRLWKAYDSPDVPRGTLEPENRGSRAFHVEHQTWHWGVEGSTKYRRNPW